MLADLFSCPSCSIQFDQENHIPKLLPSCQHTLCSTCTDSILVSDRKFWKCPLDHVKFEVDPHNPKPFPTNLILLQVIEQKFKTDHKICNEHRKPKDLICLDDKTWICEECDQSDKHRGHTIKSAQQLKAEAEQKKEKLEAWLDEFGKENEEAEYYFRGLEKGIATLLTQEFDKIRESLKMKEKKVFLEIQTLLDEYKEEIQKSIGKDDLLKEKLRKHIADLDNSQINARFIDTFKKLDKKKYSTSHIIQLLEHVKRVENNCKSAVKALGTSITSAIEGVGFDLSSDLSFEGVLNQPQENIQESSILPESFNISMLAIKVDKRLLKICPKASSEESIVIESNVLKEIKSIMIQFDKIQPMEQHMDELKRVYGFCEKVSKLILSFKSEYFKDEDLARFCSDSFWATEKIESLFVNLGSSQVSDMSVKDLIINSLSKMPNIKSFELYLDRTNITDQSIELLASHFRSTHTYLSHFGLELNETHIRDPSIIKLCESLKPISRDLKSVWLILSRTRVTDKSIIALGREFLRSIEQLNIFKLDLYDTKITDKGFESLCNSATKQLRNLTKLVLSLNRTQITNISLGKFNKKILAKMSSLEDLGFYIGESLDRYVDASIVDFSSNLEKVANHLKSLDLDFSGAHVTDIGLIPFSQHVIPKLTSLKIFDLNLEGTQIAHNGIKKLCDNFKDILKNLTEFSIHLQNSTITEISVQMLLEMVDLSVMKDLTVFLLELSDVLVDKETQSRLEGIKTELAKRKEERNIP